MKWSKLNSKIYRPPKSKPTGNNTIKLIVRFEFSSKLLQNKNCDKNYLLVFYQVFLYVYYLEDTYVTFNDMSKTFLYQPTLSHFE